MTESNEVPGQSEEIRRASTEITGRLIARGIRVAGTERPEDLVEMLEAIERFETAVEARGGDLMVDEGRRGRATEPDDPHFALPVRREHETVADYLERLERATDDVRRHRQRGD